MRIAIVSDAIPPITDGVTRTLCELASTLLERRVEFIVVSAIEPPPTLPWRDRVHVVPSIPLFFYPSYRLGIPFRGALDAVLDGFAPDLVHVVSPSLLALWAAGYARRRRVSAVASFHTDFASCLPFYGLGAMTGVAWRLARGLYNRYATTFAPSQFVAEKLRENGVENVRIWRRGVDPERFGARFRCDTLRRSLSARERRVLLYVGRLCREKNLFFLVDAANELVRRGVRFELVLVGDGPLRRELEVRLPLARFTGFLRGDELSRWYASADLFVFPSTVETFGNVVLEAFASEVPVVALAAGGVRELVTPGWDGLLASPTCAAGFADQIQDLLSRPSDLARLARNARATSLGYRWSDVNGGLLNEYARLAGRTTTGELDGVAPARVAPG